MGQTLNCCGDEKNKEEENKNEMNQMIKFKKNHNDLNINEFKEEGIFKAKAINPSTSNNSRKQTSNKFLKNDLQGKYSNRYVAENIDFLGTEPEKFGVTECDEAINKNYNQTLVTENNRKFTHHKNQKTIDVNKNDNELYNNIFKDMNNNGNKR